MLYCFVLVCWGACPPDAVADAGDRLPVPEIQQSKSPVKRTLVGTVTDASTGETLIGVNVIIKGTTQGTVTDLDGKFSIEVTGKDEIEISYIGYKTQTIEVGDLGVLNVKMEGGIMKFWTGSRCCWCRYSEESIYYRRDYSYRRYTAESSDIFIDQFTGW